MSRLNWDHAQLGMWICTIYCSGRTEINMKAYSLSDNFIILHLIEYVKMIPLAKLKIGVFWALLFPFTSLFLSWEEWYCRHLGVLSFQLQRVLKSSVLLFFLYIYLVIDCPKQKGKDVAIVAWCTFCRTNFSCTTNLRSQRLIKIWKFKYIFVVKKSGLRK